MAFNGGVGERRTDICAHYDIYAEWPGDRSCYGVELVAYELAARDDGGAIDDVLRLAAAGDAHRMPGRLDLGQIVVDVPYQHRIAADRDRARHERRKREFQRGIEIAFRYRDAEIGAHAIALACP
jgi:hypothetical protein